MIEFKLFVTLYEQADFTDDGDWHLKPTRVGFRTGQPHSDIFTVRDRLIETLPVAFDKLQPEMMLKPACLFCGRPLTDPVSMARWIGPEWGHCGGNYAVRGEPSSVREEQKVLHCGESSAGRWSPSPACSSHHNDKEQPRMGNNAGLLKKVRTELIDN